MPGRIPTLPLFQSLRLRKLLHSFVPFCIVMPTHGEGRGWGEFLPGGKGESKAWNDDDVGLMMKWSAFYILFTKEFLRARGEHILLFCFAFTFRTLLCSLHTLLWKIGGLRKLLRQTFASEEECLRPMKNVRAQSLRLKRNVCGLWKMFAPALCAWREMFAAYEKCLRLLRNVCGLLKMFAPNLCARREMELKKEKIGNQNQEKTIEQLQIPEEWKSE